MAGHNFDRGVWGMGCWEGRWRYDFEGEVCGFRTLMAVSVSKPVWASQAKEVMYIIFPQAPGHLNTAW